MVQNVQRKTGRGVLRLTNNDQRGTMFRKIQHIHFVGIGGAGMSGIAEVLLTLGYHVTGSDLHESESVRRIRALGGAVFLGHAASNLRNAQEVVFSSALPPPYPALRARHAAVAPGIS